MLEQEGIQVDYRPTIKPADVPDALPGFDGIIVRSKMRITADAIAKADKLKFVARAGAGVDNIDEVALKERNITLVAANEGNRQAVGEFAVGTLLSMMRNISVADKQVRQKVWLREANRGEEISSRTVGIIGFGNMGQSFAKVLSGFGCRIIAYDRYAPEKVQPPVTCVTLEELQQEADIVSFHIPYISTNLNFANYSFFSGFKKPIWFINTSRGDVVDLTALVKHLETGKVKGAALDVLDNEKLQTLTEQQEKNFQYLSSLDNVVLTPHIAGWTHESYVKINEVLVEKIAHLVKNAD